MSMIPWLDIAKATLETLYMVSMSTLIAIMIGLPLGTLLFASQTLIRCPRLHQSLSAFINISRSVPFIILLVALIPVTRLLIGTSIGTTAAIVPLSIGAIPFFARLVDNIYLGLPKGLIDAGHAMGATHLQMMYHLLLPDARAPLIHAITVTAITLVNYSAMAGTVGGGGLGDLAIRYGYQRFNTPVMLITVLLLIVLVQLIQWSGDRLARRCQH